MNRLKPFIILLLVVLVAGGAGAQSRSKKKKKAPTPVRPTGIWISDRDNGRIVFMEDLQGNGFISLGISGFGLGRFLDPNQIWVDEQGRIHVADTGNNRVVRFNNMNGQGWTEMAGFSSPMGVATRGDQIYVADTEKDRVLVYEEFGGRLINTLTHPEMEKPQQLWLDHEGWLYVVCGRDPAGGKIVQARQRGEHFWWDVYKGQGLASAATSPGQVVTRRKRMYYIDRYSHRLVEVESAKGGTVREAGSYGRATTQLVRPGGLAVDQEGRFYIADSGNDRLLRYDGLKDREVEEFTGSEDPVQQLRNPSSIFVWCPVPPPEEPEDEEEQDE